MIAIRGDLVADSGGNGKFRGGKTALGSPRVDDC